MDPNFWKSGEFLLIFGCFCLGDEFLLACGEFLQIFGCFCLGDKFLLDFNS